jgi:hypothetical protein
MQNYVDFSIKNHLLKIVGVFPVEAHFEKDAIDAGYQLHQFPTSSLPFYKDYFYKGFRDLYTLDGASNKVHRLTRAPQKQISVVSGNKEINLCINQVDLFLFPESFGMFSLDIRVEFKENQSHLSQFSDACFVLREFERGIVKELDVSWNTFIVNEYLLGHKTRGEGIDLDEYSGTKFKLFVGCEFEEILDLETQNALMYDIGCVVPPGTAMSNDMYSPSDEYKQHLINNYQFSTFRNWRGIALLDTFVVVGNSMLGNEYQLITFRENYFLIYLHNLYVKYNLFKFNTGVSDFKVDLRPELREFLNSYNLTFVSYNFLPTMINSKLREALEIEQEVHALTQRIQEIGVVVEEKSQEKTNILLGLVSFVASLSAIEPIWGYMVNIQQFFSWPAYTAYLIFVGTVGAVLTFVFYMPDKIKNYINRWI